MNLWSFQKLSSSSAVHPSLQGHTEKNIEFDETVLNTFYKLTLRKYKSCLSHWPKQKNSIILVTGESFHHSLQYSGVQEAQKRVWSAQMYK